ncbi:MAG: NAD(P)H-dependent glycerol-3-phosphate dehydrogenase, partial [Phaeodactylibacter sp.]|nr:NAD(P)H-dependent glycerol-3-phosphate dehydrogenase [Phaeodactylibacter sp.]
MSKLQEGVDRSEPVGVIGAGSFGTAVANLLANNTDVLIYARDEDTVAKINAEHINLDVPLSPRIRATADIREIAEKCEMLFPIVPSDNFRDMMRDFSPYLHPYHLMIHGTKGFDLKITDPSAPITRDNLRTMTEVIREESVVVRVGCLSGPNLAREIFEGQPTATVVASQYEEVIQKTKQVLSSKRFQVFGSHEVLGAELAGALKNTIAIGSGILSGMGMGKNIQALLITRGLMEMIRFGEAMGASPKAFLGTAGIGDLICTATSTKSRNFTFGRRLGEGEAINHIKATMPEL